MSDFHFIRPLWLLAIGVLFIVLHLLKKQQIKKSGWQRLLPKHLSTVLIGQQDTTKPLSLIMPFIIGFLAIVAMAGPAWKKLPQPVYQLEKGSVLIMDMSYSMFSTDISPNRLTQARYKASDLLDNLAEGEIGLIAYAGDAFTISPLTDDVNNVKLLLPSLTPDIMPVNGSNPLAALEMAHEMLINAGHIDGDIYWFTDDVENDEIEDITQWSNKHPHRLNILGVGTQSGAPIKLTDGNLLKDNSGAIVIPRLPTGKLTGLAQRGDGVYQTINNSGSDIKALVDYVKQAHLENEKTGKSEDLNMGDQWEEEGAWIVILVLPLLLYYFRRGMLLSLLPVMFLMPNKEVYASTWQDLWKTQDQQAQKKFDDESFTEAAEQFTDEQWQGSAHYKAGNYKEALAEFKKSDSAEAMYNQGNSYAQLQQLDKAIESYTKALEKNPNLEQAKQNMQLVQQMKEQQEQENDQNGDGDDSEKEQSDENSEDQKSQGGEENQEQQSSDQQDSENNQQGQEGEQKNDEAPESEEQKSQHDEADAQEIESDEQQQAEPNKEGDEGKEGEEKSPAQLMQEKLDQETDQRHQQLINKVTDDPYLLLRNKMQLEYKKRRYEQPNSGVNKQW